MDPRATLLKMMQSVAWCVTSAERRAVMDEKRDAREDLANWLTRGGFEPECRTDEERSALDYVKAWNKAQGGFQWRWRFATEQT